MRYLAELAQEEEDRDYHERMQWMLSEESREEEKKKTRDEQRMMAKLARERETREKEREMLDEH